MLETVVFQLLNAVVWAWVLALLALGLTLVFGYLDIVNVAHGALYSVGAVTAWYVTVGLSAGVGFLAAVVISPIVVAVIGVIAFQVALRPIETQPPILTLITTFGLLFIIQHVLFLIFGGAPRVVEMPVSYNFPLLGRTYPLYRIVVVLLSVGIIAALWLFLHRSSYGSWIRAVQQNREVSTAMGIPARQVSMVVFGLGSALAGLAGVLAAPLLQIRYDMGVDIIIDAFIIVIAAGFGNLAGTILVALIYQMLQGLAVLVITPVQAKVIALAMILIWVLIRREGLLRREMR